MTVDDVLEAIEIEPIVAAIRAEPLVNWGYEDAAKIVWNVASRFLPGDLERYVSVAGVEQHWVLEMRPGMSPIISANAYADHVVGAARESGSSIIHGYADLVMFTPDGVEVIDWKTAGDLDKAWTERLNDSWQWRLYCLVYGADAFVYRGIEKAALAPKIPGQPYDWGKAPMKELRYQPSDANSAAVLNWLATTFAMRSTLEAQFPLGPWARRMPDACRSYGQRCGYWDACRGGAQPEGVYGTKALSYSGASKFLNCPEHYRLSTLTGIRESSAATDLGNAVHRGTAALYEQFGRIKETLYGSEEAGATEGEHTDADGQRGAERESHCVSAGPDAIDGPHVHA